MAVAGVRVGEALKTLTFSKIKREAELESKEYKRVGVWVVVLPLWTGLQQ